MRATRITTSEVEAAKRKIRSLVRSCLQWWQDDPRGAMDAILEGLLGIAPETVWSWITRKADENRSGAIRARMQADAERRKNR